MRTISRRVGRSSANRRDGRECAILVYHRIGASNSDPLRLNVTPAKLDEHLAVIANAWRPLSLAGLTSGMQERDEPPERSIVVTFDDGYHGVLGHALPLLERYEVPATAFTVTGFVDDEFWWETLDALVRDSTAPLERLKLEVDGQPLRWKRSRLRAWRQSISPRDALYYALVRRLRMVSPAERSRALADVAAWSGVEVDLEQDRRPLSTNGLRTLAASEIVEIGGHTVSHPVLAGLTPAEQHGEIAGAKATLERLIGCDVTSFAYPYGGRHEYDDSAVTLARHAGYRRACANVQAPVRRGASMFELPRLIVGDWDGETFARRLQQWLGPVARARVGANS